MRGPLLAAVAYAVVAKLGQELLLVQGLAPVWAASGVAVLMAWRWRARGVAVLLIADLAVSLTPPTELELGVALGTAAGTTGEAIVGAWILWALSVRPELDRVRDVWGLGAAAAAASAVGALVGGSALELADGASGDLLLTWRAWAFGDALGIVLLGGAILAWGVASRGPQQPATTGEIAGLTVALTGVAALGVWVAVALLPLAFPLVVLIAVRGRSRGTVAGLGAAALLLVLATTEGHGPFTAADQVDGLVSLQAMLASVTITVLALGAALSERERVTQALRATARSRDRAQAELRRLALRDPLTGLANRDLLADRLGHALARSPRVPGHCGVAFLDLDRFKALNDAFGHARGDEVLRRVAPRIAAVVRPGDTVARFGGDEFVIVCEGLPDEASLRELVRRVLTAIAEPLHLDGGEVTVTATAGLALSGPGCHTVEDLLRDADAAMYAAKRAGGGSIAMRDSTSRDEVRRRHALEHALRGAAGRGELRLDYQPMVRAEDRAVVAVEALLRWEHPQEGLLGPHAFIGLAESTGLITELGEWVLRTACTEARSWGEHGPRVSVNVSARQLGEPGFPGAVRRVLADTGLPGTRLQLELTETAVLDAAAASGVLDELAATGACLALDDVGTGWSSLGRVRELPIGVLKIDRSFVVDLGAPGPEGAAAHAVVRAIAGIGAALGVATVAEGVETEAQAAEVAAAGATTLQGYLLARPMPAARLRAYLGGGAQGRSSPVA